tara:strand:+ start:84 stop:881 length:798 start_codon:yes stop_codon:yes gene_type:complete
MSSHTLHVLFVKVVNKFFGKHIHIGIKENLTYAKDNLFTYNRAPFLTEPVFVNAYNKGKATDNDVFLKGIDLEWRLHTLCWAAEQSIKLDGDFVEFGVRTSFFSTTIMDYLKFENEAKRFVLVDSFAGVIPELLIGHEAERERHGVKSERVWEDIYKKVIDRFSDAPNVEVIKGVVPDVLESLNLKKVAFVSLDLNSALPEQAVLNYIWDKLVPGGIIVLDDYGYPGFEEQQLVHDEFARKHNTSVLCLPTCQGIIVKPNNSIPA